MSDVKWAVIEGPPSTIQAYLPKNYKVVGFYESDTTIHTFIEGKDGDSGSWTLDGYVRPRLESGLYFGLTELPFDPFNINDIYPWPRDTDS